MNAPVNSNGGSASFNDWWNLGSTEVPKYFRTPAACYFPPTHQICESVSEQTGFT